MEDKLNSLRKYIRDLGSLAVGFSGGVDSTFLLAVAAEELGDKVIAVTDVGSFVPKREIREAEEFCRERGIRHYKAEFDPLSDENCAGNPPDRCYHCKKHVFGEVIRIASEQGMEYVAEGSNMDDLGDYRPGLKAVSELEIVSPLRAAELHKREIRELSKRMGLPTWNKPSYACLASRFVYGEQITAEKLKMVDEAEQYLIEKGFTEERVRIHGNLARIEVPAADIEKLADRSIREDLYNELKRIGFLYVTLDLGGYRTGSMNEALPG